MKLLRLLIVLSILFLVPAYSHSENLGDLRISLIEGDVQIRTEDTGGWVPASINIPLIEGDRLWVPEEGKTELQLRDGTYLRLDQNSALEILTLEKDSFQFYLNEGQAYANFRGRKGSLLQMDTPFSSTRAYDHSVFRVAISPEGLNRISVLKGSVDVESRSGKTIVKSGYTLTLKDDTFAELAPLGPPDDWERWNMERDRRLAERRPPSSYLPEELYGYASDFENYGSWVYVREYGYIWRPTVVVSVGWAPYRIGRWVWIRGDYVWISYEPWGWVPYHYGRWAFVASFGWCWVPPVRGAVFWGPGFVAWVRTPTYVAWVPLGPRETYYGRGYYGPHSVNITNINITKIQVNSTGYRNIHIHNAVTVVHHDTFVKGKHVDVKIKENPFLKEKISVVGPDIKHEKTTVMPVIKEVPKAKRPPEPIREIRVKEIKEKRPFVKEREASVFRPGSTAKEMTLKVKEAKPVQRNSKTEREPRPPQKEVEKSREVKPSEIRIEKPRSVNPPPEREPEKAKDIKPSETGSQKTRESKQDERRMERPRETKPPEKTTEKMEKTRASKPQEKGIETGRPMEKATESRTPERRSEKPNEAKRSEGRVERPQETGPQGRRTESSKELKQPERKIESPRESRPPERKTEKSRATETKKERSVELGSVEKKVQSPKEDRAPEKGMERSREPRPSDKR